MRSYRWAEPARRFRPGTDCLTGALCIAHAYTNTHGGSDGYRYRYRHSYGDVYIHAYTDGHSDVDTTATIPPTPTATATATATATFTPTPTPTCNAGAYAYTTGSGAFVPGTTNIGINCDDCGVSISLPFPVTLYDQTFTSATAGSNGMLAFGTAFTSFGVTCLPESSATYSIGPLWVDQYPVTATCPACGVFTTVTGTAPNRQFYIE